MTTRNERAALRGGHGADRIPVPSINEKPRPPMPWRNAARCLLCGDVVESRHRHDFQTCSCGNLSVDGGPDYLRRVVGEAGSSEEVR